MTSSSIYLESLTAVAAVLGVAGAGHRRFQPGFMVVAFGSGTLGILCGPSGDAHGSAHLIAMVAGLGLLATSAWNLVSKPGERWAFRVVIYGFYAAAFVTAGAMFDSHVGSGCEITRREWINSGAIYGLSSILLVSTKPWFARRMFNENTSGNSK